MSVGGWCWLMFQASGALGGGTQVEWSGGTVSLSLKPCTDKIFASLMESVSSSGRIGQQQKTAKQKVTKTNTAPGKKLSAALKLLQLIFSRCIHNTNCVGQSDLLLSWVVNSVAVYSLWNTFACFLFLA